MVAYGTQLLSGSSATVVSPVSPSADPTGAVNAAAVSAALAALPASGGVVKLQPNVAWNLKCGVVTATTGQYIDAGGCTINMIGAGDLFRFVDTSNYSTRSLSGGAGLLGYPVVDGTATTGNSCIVHAGDILQLAVFVQAQNCTAGTTSKAVWFDNQYYFTEQAYGRIHASNCTAAVVFDNSANPSGQATSSFARPDIQVYIDAQAQQNGVVLQNGAVLYDGPGLGIFGNMVTTAAANTAAVLSVLGQGSTGSNTNYSAIACPLQIGVESDTIHANGPMTIRYTDGNNTIAGPGYVDFPFGHFTASNLPGAFCFVFTGPVTGDSVLAQFAWSFQDTISAPAGVQLAQFAAALPVTANNQVINVGAVTYIRLSAAAAFTGLQLNNVNGLYGQLVVLVNESAFPLAFDVPATSSVASGRVIPAGGQMTYIYDHFTGLWYPAVPGQATAVLGAAFTSGTGTAQQPVTGLSAYLGVGTWKVRGWFPYAGAGTVGSTQTFAFTFGGAASASAGYVAWQNQAAAYSPPVTGAAVTTPAATATITSTVYYMEVTATVVVTAAGVLQLTVQSATSGDEITVESGAFLETAQAA